MIEDRKFLKEITRDEVWFLKIDNRVVLEIPTRTKHERILLNSVRKGLIENGIDINKINLTNRGFIQIRNKRITAKQVEKRYNLSKRKELDAVDEGHAQ
jgi:hypothetical protein